MEKKCLKFSAILIKINYKDSTGFIGYMIVSNARFTVKYPVPSLKQECKG